MRKKALRKFGVWNSEFGMIPHSAFRIPNFDRPKW